MNDPVSTIKKFHTRIGEFELGKFDTLQGLGCRVELEELNDDGLTPLTLLPSRVRLTRAPSRQTLKVWQWFSHIKANRSRLDATITAVSEDGSAVVRWSLRGVAPLHWSGLGMSPSENPALDTEELELIFQEIADMELVNQDV
ncbi:phage tail protein [Streptomyces sp. NPDC053474]|uniref:phage tail protein n=1 Tax=Streptomyces sp. NPDC053474 TaxID=3365704 RepID=UPI0037D2EBDB